MAKIRITVRSLRTEQEWFEDYDKAGIGDNGNQQQAEDWAFGLVKWFNDTRRPGESERKLLKTEIIGQGAVVHDWYKRTDGMSTEFRGRLVDIFECRKCGITGKRFSLGSNIRRDSKYKAKKYEECSSKRVD